MNREQSVYMSVLKHSEVVVGRCFDRLSYNIVFYIMTWSSITGLTKETSAYKNHLSLRTDSFIALLKKQRSLEHFTNPLPIVRHQSRDKQRHVSETKLGFTEVDFTMRIEVDSSLYDHTCQA